MELIGLKPSNTMEFQGDPQFNDYFLRIESSPRRASDTETICFRTQLKRAEDELHRLDAELAILLAKRSRVTRHINRCRTSLAPYRKLPTELIEEIIKFSLPRLQPLPPSDGKNDSRLQITQICSSWRKVAFGIPTLWNVYLNKPPGTGTMSLISDWFRQCSSKQIYFEVALQPDVYTYSTPASLFTKMLTPYAHRVKSLSFLPIHPSDCGPVSWDVLTTLSVNFLWHRNTSHESMVAPSLQKLRVKNMFSLFQEKPLSTLPDLPWKQLTILSLDGAFSISQVYDILLRCTSIEHCRFTNIRIDSPEIPPNASLVLPRLRSLWINLGEPGLFRKLLLFHVPNLSSLKINHPPNRPEFLANFITFMEILENTLQHLEFVPFDSSYEMASMDIIIHAIPSVTHFLTTQYIPQAVLRKIGTGEFLPNIEVLHFRAPENCSVGESLDLLIPQLPGRTRPLRDVKIYALYHSPRLPQIQGLLSQGINVHFSYPR